MGCGEVKAVKVKRVGAISLILLKVNTCTFASSVLSVTSRCELISGQQAHKFPSPHARTGLKQGKLIFEKHTCIASPASPASLPPPKLGKNEGIFLPHARLISKQNFGRLLDSDIDLLNNNSSSCKFHAKTSSLTSPLHQKQKQKATKNDNPPRHPHNRPPRPPHPRICPHPNTHNQRSKSAQRMDRLNTARSAPSRRRSPNHTPADPR